MKKFVKLLKGLLLAFGTLAVIGFVIYTAAWFSFTKQTEMHLEQILKSQDFKITGEIPNFTNYPMPPIAHFSGTIEHKSGLRIETPQIKYTGFPVTGQRQYIEAPQGLKISATFLERELNFDYALLDVTLPKYFPSTLKKNDILQWQKSNAPFVINHIRLASGAIMVTGNGTIALDENLQIVADINARVIGMDMMLDDLEKQHGEKTIAMARSFYNMMSATDEMGQKYFETTLKIQNNGIFFGPMRISGLPKINWTE